MQCGNHQKPSPGAVLTKVFLQISQNSQENTCARASFLIKLQASNCSFIKKEALAQVFSCEFYEIFKKTFFLQIPPVAASAHEIIFFQINSTSLPLVYFITVLISQKHIIGELGRFFYLFLISLSFKDILLSFFISSFS